MIRKKLIAIALVSAMMLSAAGCGGKTEEFSLDIRDLPVGTNVGRPPILTGRSPERSRTM